MKRPTVGDVTRIVDCLVPVQWSEEWDNVGLQVGNPDSTVGKIGVGLETTPAALEEVNDRSIDMLITHHPLIFKPVRRVIFGEGVGEAIHQLVARRIALYAAHTNLDVSDLGPSHVLGLNLGLEDLRPISPRADLVKLTVFVPAETVEVMGEALGEAGAGNLGRYSHCTFASEGEGTFWPSVDADPYAGKPGELTRVTEFRLETIAPADLVPDLLDVLHEVHPYEEPAFDVHSLENTRDVGMGRIGNLPRATKLRGIIARLSDLSGCRDMRYIGDPDADVVGVAVACGAGSGLWRRARGMGADLLITGDVGYHDAEEMTSSGLSVIDLGHAASEAPFLGAFADAVREAVVSRGGFDCEVVEMRAKSDPWIRMDSQQ